MARIGRAAPALRFAAVLSLLVAAVCVSGNDDSEVNVEDEPLLPLPLVVSRHLEGRWNALWTEGCTQRLTKGSLYFRNETAQWFAWRKPSGDKVDVDISGEGTVYGFLPFLQHVPRPKSSGAKEMRYGYQICTQTKNMIPTPSDENRWGLVTEVRVMRGFVFEVDSDGADVLTLDRCVDGLNRNYNFFVTTVGQPVEEEETGPGPLTRKIRLVRWQLRLPGNAKCDHMVQPVDTASTIQLGADVGAASDAFDTLLWTRSEPPVKSFFEEHFAMIVFAGLFIAFRIFVSFRFHSQKLTIQREFLKEVADEESRTKETILKEADKKKAIDGKKK